MAIKAGATVGTKKPGVNLNTPKRIGHGDKHINDSPRQPKSGDGWDKSTSGANLPKYPC